MTVEVTLPQLLRRNAAQRAWVAFRDAQCAYESNAEARGGSMAPMVYSELRRLARHYMARERPDHTLQPTALVHEAYMRLADFREFFRDGHGVERSLELAELHAQFGDMHLYFGQFEPLGAFV